LDDSGEPGVSDFRIVKVQPFQRPDSRNRTGRLVGQIVVLEIQLLKLAKRFEMPRSGVAQLRTAGDHRAESVQTATGRHLLVAKSRADNADAEAIGRAGFHPCDHDDGRALVGSERIFGVERRQFHRVRKGERQHRDQSPHVFQPIMPLSEAPPESSPVLHPAAPSA
jgi:hypothetical protein